MLLGRSESTESTLITRFFLFLMFSCDASGMEKTKEKSKHVQESKMKINRFPLMPKRLNRLENTCLHFVDEKISKNVFKCSKKSGIQIFALC